jgi:hypothetical protein
MSYNNATYFSTGMSAIGTRSPNIWWVVGWVRKSFSEMGRVRFSNSVNANVAIVFLF